MKPKVLILTSWYPQPSSPIGGVFVKDQARFLSECYEVYVLHPVILGWRRMLGLQKGAPQLVEHRHRNEIIAYHREAGVAPPIRFFPRFWYRRYVCLAKQGFQKIVKEWGKPDILHAHVVLPGGWAATQLGRLFSIPVVLTEHSGPFSSHLDTSYSRRLVLETLRSAATVIAVSPSLANEIKTTTGYNGDVRIIGNVIDSRFFVPSSEESLCSCDVSPHDVYRFLSIGGMSWQKGYPYLVEACRILKERGWSRFKLVLGGDGPLRGELERQVVQLDLQMHIEFLRFLRREEVRRQIQECDVFVLASLHETFGIVLGEAMACGKPVIATRCGGPEFVVTPETGILVEKGNPMALADAMERFLKQEVSFDPCTIRHSVVSRFGEEAFLRNMSEIYEEVLSPGVR